MTIRDAAVESIRKRDGRCVGFDIDKISNAIGKAFLATLGDTRPGDAARLAEQVYDLLIMQGLELPDVETVQDAVERVLIQNGYVGAAKAYILYRAERSRVREMNTRLMQVYEDITFSNASDSDIKRENANIDGDTAMGTMLKYGSEGAKRFNEMFVLSPDHNAAHKSGDIHIHDLDFLTLTTTCCQIDLVKLFKGGFCTGHGALREPTNIASYAALCCIAIQSNQNDQHGGQSVANFDYGLAPGVAKTYVRMYRDNIKRALSLLCGMDNVEIEWPGLLKPALSGDGGYNRIEARMLSQWLDLPEVERVQAFARRHAAAETERATYKAMVALVHNLNTMHSRAGAQTPFSTINYGTDTSPEGRMVIRNILLATEAGLGSGETSIFPIQIFKVKAGVSYNQDDPNYDLFRLACRVSAKRLFPNFSFLDAPFNAKYYKEGRPETEIGYMGCRTRVIANVYDPGSEITTGRGNLSFTSVNLPRLGIEAGGDIALFYQKLDAILDLVVDQLMRRYSIQAKKKARNFPFLMGQGVWLGSEELGPDDEVGEALKHGTLSIGFIGLAETLCALVGSHHGQTERARRLGFEIISHMRRRCDEYSRRMSMNVTLLATPAEGLSGRFVGLDQKKYGLIPGVTDKEYYTNSFHIPVNFPITAYDKINAEAPYHALTNAGHITYVEVDGDPARNLDAFEQIIRTMAEAGVGYGSINHPVDRDPVCGFSGVIDERCPSCGRTENPDDEPFERIRRITGYLVGTRDRFNNAKRAEERDRVKHK
ncbi:MAG: anaerobic ribonucleoside triphosphate reductase [Oscillospiraceae bacterium]|nr:anaerobic ribonucleoside triphosphate reductase [Oscillospiraceae bacterium]